MACMRQVTCSAKLPNGETCGKKYMENVNRPGVTPYVCGECRERERDGRWHAHLAGLSKLSTEERLQKIERWIFEYNPPGGLGAIVY